MRLTLILAVVVASTAVDEWYQECHGEEECSFAATGKLSDVNCFDKNENCRKHFLLGECQSNADWMHINCAESCGQCGPTEPDDVESCQDLHNNCAHWAEQMECFANPAFMSRSCPKSCWLCVNPAELRQEGVSEEEILWRFRFSKTDFGLWQVQSEKDDSGNVQRALKEMGRYAKSRQRLGPGTLCNNVHHECVQWATRPGSCESNLDFMLPQCSLACQFCDVVEKYHQCKRTEPSERKSITDLSTIPYLLHDKGATNLLGSFGGKSKDDEWIMTFEYRHLWGSQAEQRLEELISIVSTESGRLEWKHAQNSTTAVNGSVPSRGEKRSGRIAICNQVCQDTDSSISSLVGQISRLLGIGPSYFESLEFVHYERGQRWSAHHDFQIHDTWRHAGIRVLTVFVVLKPPDEGGSIGFPEYDWLQEKDSKILIWPNVKEQPQEDSIFYTAIRGMKSEQLPVVEGELYGVYVRVRQYPFESANSCS